MRPEGPLPEKMVEPPQVMIDPPMPEPLMPGEVELKTPKETKADAAKPEGEDDVPPKTGVVYAKEAAKTSVLMDAMKPAVAPAMAG
jgi:hypothetical protein